MNILEDYIPRSKEAVLELVSYAFNSHHPSMDGIKLC